MDSNRRDGQTQPATFNRDSQQQRGEQSPLTSLEGMNFEEQRSSYKNNDAGGARNNRTGQRSSGTEKND